MGTSRYVNFVITRDGKGVTGISPLSPDLDYEYFTTIEGVCTYVSGIIGKKVKTRADMEQAISDWNGNTEDDDKMIYFNAY